MKNLTTTGDISYFTINGDIYGIDSTDGSAVACHDAESPAERIDYNVLADALDRSEVDYVDDYVAETMTWYGQGFHLLEKYRSRSFKIVEV